MVKIGIPYCIIVCKPESYLLAGYRIIYLYLPESTIIYLQRCFSNLFNISNFGDSIFKFLIIA